MARPHPLRRLIDGRPGDAGRRIARRTALLMVPAMVGANATGAVVVFALIAFVLPLPDARMLRGDPSGRPRVGSPP